MSPSYIPYLTLNDYLTTIRSGQLVNQILDSTNEGGDFERKEAESFAIDEMRSVLGSYFYLDFELRPTLPYQFGKKYYAGDRIVIDFPVWVAGTEVEGEGDGSSELVSYNIGDCVIWNGGGSSLNWIGYSCITPNSSTSFVPTEWIVIGKQYDIFYVNFPYKIFQLVPSPQIGIDNPGLYKVGDNVCWLKNLYQCRNNSWILGHQPKEQFYTIDEIPTPNIFPNQQDDQFTDGNRQWIDKGEFFLKGELPFYPTEETEGLNDGVDAWTDQYRKSWTFGDNRSNTVKQILISIAIYKLLRRNSYMMKERSIERDWAYRKMEAIRKGEVTTLIPIIQPEQVGDISWGGRTKIRNTF